MFGDLIIGRNGSIGPNFMYYNGPSMLYSYMFMVSDMLLYFIITWYLDHLLESNRGTKHHPLFFLSLQFWGVKRRRKLSEHNLVMKKLVSFNQFDTASQEKEKVLILEEEGAIVEGIRVVGLAKTYRKFLCCNSNKDINALKPLYLEIDKGEILALLGQNGAGKTTFINILIGLLHPTRGKAIIKGIDTTINLDKAQKLVGIVQQFDCLWEDLTVEEHIALYAALKGETQIEHCVQKSLRQVGLLNSRFLLVKALSGGMKRRLSVAIGCIGNPPILILDEPTTGMDPLNRNQIWDLIHELKKGRTIILTTHLMEEAEVLSDRIAILVEGDLYCVGTPLVLKNMYGDGYK